MSAREKMMAEQLGMTHTRAQRILNRMLTFDHICRLGLNTCYHCEEPMCLDTYTLGYKVPWFTFEDIVSAFFDPANMAVAHNSCNRSVGRKAVTWGDGPNSDKLAEKLGIRHSTAHHHRIKQIRFGFIQQLGLDTCFQCSESITDIDTLSVEHMVSWLHKDTARELFFDLSNISFSHLLCNTMGGRPLQPCPSFASYHRDCRCDGCRKAYTEYHVKWKEKNREDINAKRAEYYQKNKEVLKAKRRQRRADGQEET